LIKPTDRLMERVPSPQCADRMGIYVLCRPGWYGKVQCTTAAP